jgi:hypothetical protein
MADGILAISSLRHAGIQAPRMRPDTSMSTWVPAVHAGTTSSCNDYVTHANLMAIVLHPTKFSKESRRPRRVRIFILLIFVNFVSFVVGPSFFASWCPFDFAGHAFAVIKESTIE